MSAYRIQGIPAILVPRMWVFAEPYVKRALDHAAGEIGVADLKQLCLERDAQLWLVNHDTRVVGAAVTEIVAYPQRKHARVITVAGSAFSDWLPLFDDTIVTWATSQGCDAIEAHVRRGLVQKLAPQGYKHLHSVVVKKLSIITEAPATATAEA